MRKTSRIVAIVLLFLLGISAVWGAVLLLKDPAGVIMGIYSPVFTWPYYAIALLLMAAGIGIMRNGVQRDPATKQVIGIL